MNTNCKDWKYEGEKAFKRGRDLEDCEYDPGTEAYRQWTDGWIAASEEFEDRDYER